jgi:hypothetical protein
VRRVPDGGASTFPAREAPTVRVDSIAEEYAYLSAWPPADGVWERVGQMLVPGPNGPEHHITVRAPDGTVSVVRFAIGSFYGKPDAPQPLPGERVTTAMRAGHELAREESPLHPGSMPQYPVPSESYPGAVAVPLPILAVDAGQRGLYAPPRFAVVRWPSSEAVGVGDAPGFDPGRWPPPRLGDWPPVAVRDWRPDRLAGAIERFTALWARVLDTWYDISADSHLDDERREALALMRLLLPARMLDVYAGLSPKFWAWLREPQRDRASPAGTSESRGPC